MKPAVQVSRQSAWSRKTIDSYLSGAVIPIRLAVPQGDYPLLCSIWFVYDEDAGLLKCASHESSLLVQALRDHPRCSFEIAPNDPPYKGVRGRGEVSLSKQNAEPVLNQLISRYLGTTDSPLADWLLGRAEEEYVLEITPVWLTGWDYSRRMGNRQPSDA